ncbi:elongation factor Ts [Candidatus Falkowbacteria bacterium RIFOXYB2_FULL_38_15]|uniref:Elongation factor Ts n=1 Tax=Candidatus Falkowbacteria bacterium RIFOXYA2_FULL_38_12 TaxID=1797993 RepID=A0A1F5S317_9BACT|nr:MAG: elongation factor Ts [Candidatus Falkowbacteria bacterium RIFOXYA2_FULL_38_12]OGF32457.1 MAG: elongation factor Ts [Candidatus Falkowbacteria bacterium RIFOXYB2_FULL_38_15]OGF42416.1 MAG: elongation factor Ts [Candidatus Falkowbacteria bacterium RIFOXYD2_FULL_39_16]
MSLDLKLITSLREKTGAGIVECKSALSESDGNVEKAIEILRKKGEIKAAKKSAERTAKEGLVHAYVHANGRVGAMVELSCETDFVARNEEFQGLAHDLAMQIVATAPLYLSPDDVPEELVAKEKEIYFEEIKAQGKPEAVAEKIMEGKIAKYFGDICLLRQPFIKDEDVTVEELINQKIAKIGEKIEIKKIARFEI